MNTNLTVIENIVIFADVQSNFTFNVIKALRTISPNSDMFIVSRKQPDFILPVKSYYINFNEFVLNIAFKKSIDTYKSLAVAIHATEYGVELDMFENLKKIVLFTGDDTLFKRSANRVLTDKFNAMFESVNAIGFSSFFHQQEYIAFLKSPALLIPFGYQTKEVLPDTFESIKIKEFLTENQLNNGNYNIAIIPPNNLLSVVEKIRELETYFSTFGVDNHLNYNIVCTQKEYQVLQKYLSAMDFSCLIKVFCYEERQKMSSLLRVTDMTISFKEIYSVNGAFNIFLEKNHPIFTYFTREYSDFENMGTHVFNFESIEGLSRKVTAILAKLDTFEDSVAKGYKRLMEKHSFVKLQEKLKRRIEQIFANDLHPCHEDTDFELDDDKPMMVFTHFANIASHKNSVYSSRIRTMKNCFRNKHRTFDLTGQRHIVLKKFQYLKFLLQEHKIQKNLFYEEALPFPHPEETEYFEVILEIRNFIENKGLKYHVYYDQFAQIYPSFVIALKEEKASYRFQALRNEILTVSQIATTIYIPSSNLSDIFLRGILPKSHKNNFLPMLPAVNKTFNIYENKYISGSSDMIKIFVPIEFGNIDVMDTYLEVMYLCNELPFEFHICIVSELEHNFCKNYEKKMDQLKNVIIHFGSFMEITITMNFDLTMIFLEQDFKRAMVPTYMFDCLSLAIPLLTNKDTEASKIIEKNDIGFCINNGIEEIIKFLLKISENRELLKEKQKNIAAFVSQNSWENRIKQVLGDANAL